jgi:hypothetical protein
MEIPVYIPITFCKNLAHECGACTTDGQQVHSFEQLPYEISSDSPALHWGGSEFHSSRLLAESIAAWSGFQTSGRQA